MQTRHLPINTRFDFRGASAVALGAAVWGLFWIPLRAIEQAGLEGLTVVLIANASAALALVLLAAIFRKSTWLALRGSIFKTQSVLLGLILGASSVLYMLALLYTDVIRAVFLFYLLPVWAMLASRFLYAEPITTRQIVTIVLTILGVWLLLGGDLQQLQVRPGFGDTLAIAAGVTWGCGLALLGGTRPPPAICSALATFASAALMAALCIVLLALLDGSDALAIDITVTRADLPDDMPTITAVSGVYYSVIFGLVLLLPSVYGQVWGAERLPPTVAAILTTTEILVATVSAVLLIGTSVDNSGAVGAALIALAIWLSLHASYNQRA